MVYTKPQQGEKEERERLRGEGDKIKITDLKFERWQVKDSGMQEGKTFHKLHILGMNEDL